MRYTKLIIFLILTLLAINPVSRLVTAKSSPVPQSPAVLTLNGTFQVVNNGAGDQTEPDLDCNVTSYVSRQTEGSSLIHLIAPPATDYVVPGNGADSQPAVGGSRVAFTEANATGSGIVVYDAQTQFRTEIPGTARSNPAIGGNLIAYEDRSFSPFPNQSELGVYDLSTDTDVRLTNDLLFDKNPSVSPTGNAVVWEKCQTSGLACNIYSSVQTSPGVFTTSALTAAGENRNPDTNGQTAVYISDRSGENDIYFQPLAGGMETRIPILGDERDLSISGNLISFESRPPNQSEYDIFVYDLSTATLYQVTNTPVDEVSSRISFCNGIGRIVYVSPGADWDVYAFTFQLPSPLSPADEINNLMALVRSYNLSRALESSLISKLQDALTAVNASDTATACSSLSSFIGTVQGQSNKKITPEQKSALISSANQIKTHLGCP